MRAALRSGCCSGWDSAWHFLKPTSSFATTRARRLAASRWTRTVGLSAAGSGRLKIRKVSWMARPRRLPRKQRNWRGRLSAQQASSHFFFAESVDANYFVAGFLAALQHDIALGEF